MFNLAEKRGFISDLVTSIVADGQRSKSRTLEPDRSLAQALLRWEDLTLFKMQDFRLLFVAKCLQLHSFSGEAYTTLGRNQFDLIVDMFRVILREGNNDGDYLAIRMVYQASALFGIYVGDHVKTVRVALMKHEAWRNEELWVTTLDELVARDKQRWMNLQGPLQEMFGFDMPSDHIIKLMLSFRLKAIVRAMLELRTPFLLIETIIQRSRDTHGADLSSDEVCEPTSTPVALWLLDRAARASSLPAGPNALLTPDPDDMAEAVRSGKASSSGINPHTIVRWATESTLRASSWSSLGFSIHHELLRFAIERVAANPNKKAWVTSPALITAAPAFDRAEMSPKVRVCLCGHPFETWRPVGGYAPSHHNLLATATLICEGCFRLACSQRRLNFETTGVHEGTLLATLRLPIAAPMPPQAVGAVAIPNADIKGPTCIADFWKVETRTETQRVDNHRRKNSRDRIRRNREHRSSSSSESTVSGQPPPHVSTPSPIRGGPLPPAPPRKSSNVLPPAPPPTDPSAQRRNSRVGLDVDQAFAQTGVRSNEGASQPTATRQDGGRAGGQPAERNAENGDAQSADMVNQEHGGESGASERGQAAASDEEFKSLLAMGVEVMKHGRMGRPHTRLLFLDPNTMQLSWCSNDQWGTMDTRRISCRGGMSIQNLKEVKVANEKRRCITLVFRERSLTIEAMSQDSYDFLLAGFRALIA